MNFRCAGFLLLVAIGVTGCQSNTGPVVDFIVTPLSGGGEIRLSKDYKDKPVVVYMWATWCEPCKQEMPRLQREAAAHLGKLVVIGINMRESADVVQAFAVQIGVTYPLLINPDDATQLAYQIGGLPVTYVIAPDGLVIQRINGPVTTSQIEAVIQPYR